MNEVVKYGGNWPAIGSQYKRGPENVKIEET